MTDRRSFLKLLAATVGTAGHASTAYARQADTPPAQRASTTIRKSVLISLLPKDRSYAERFAIAREAGFEAIEMQTITRDEEAAEIREASRKAGLRVHSVMNMDHWRLALASSDADVVNRSGQGKGTALRHA